MNFLHLLLNIYRLRAVDLLTFASEIFLCSIFSESQTSYN